MKLVEVILPLPDGSAHRRLKAGIALLWFVALVFLATKHVLWRDEVRALSLALQGDSYIEMLRGLHGEGHPAVWYFVLRAANAVLPTSWVLPLVSAAIALAAVILLVRRSPFSWVALTLFLLGAPALYEYSVMARNYGISMLLMFMFATLYRRYRDRGFVLGIVLLLLANSNAHSTLLVSGFCLFWLLDLLWEKEGRQPGSFRNCWLNIGLAFIGVCLCAATIYPPFNDAARIDSQRLGFGELLGKLLLPAGSFPGLSAEPIWKRAGDVLSSQLSMRDYLPRLLMSLVLLGSMLGLVVRPAAVVAAWVALLGMSTFFAMIYPGTYRHQALWLMFLLSMYWIVGANAHNDCVNKTTARFRTVGLAFLCLLLILQIPLGLARAGQVAFGASPESRSRDLAQLIADHPELKNAIIISDPDYLVEPLPAYMPNRTYLIREGRFGRVVFFTHKAKLDITLEYILSTARQLQDSERQPVVILLSKRLEPQVQAERVRQGYNWSLSIAPEHVEAFLSAAHRIRRFEPACCSDESYDVYVLNN
jgi:hypothetical protein